MKIIRFLLLLSVLIVFSTYASEQVSNEPEPFTESVQVDLVDLYLTAVDSRGNFVKDLTKEELIIKEDGVQQAIRYFEHSSGETREVPLLLALVIDNSASMDETIDDVRKMDMARDISLNLLGEMGPLDRVLLVPFHEEPMPVGLTPDKDLITASLVNMESKFRHTALFDTLVFTFDELSEHPGRKVLFLCSDGQDNMSKNRMKDVMDRVSKARDLTVIVVGTVATDVEIMAHKTVQKTPHGRFEKGKKILEDIAERTAGYAFFPSSQKDIRRVRDFVRDFVRSQYSIVYKSSNRVVDGSWRKIDITCLRKGVNLRYRKGYYAR